MMKSMFIVVVVIVLLLINKWSITICGYNPSFDQSSFFFNTIA